MYIQYRVAKTQNSENSINSKSSKFCRDIFSTLRLLISYQFNIKIIVRNRLKFVDKSQINKSISKITELRMEALKYQSVNSSQKTQKLNNFQYQLEEESKQKER